MCFCRSQYLLLAVVVLLGLASLLGGCGAKGPLYLPEGERKQRPVQVESPAPAEQTPAATEPNPQQP
jgi:predicted small lipoprotein YifL